MYGIFILQIVSMLTLLWSGRKWREEGWRIAQGTERNWMDWPPTAWPPASIEKMPLYWSVRPGDPSQSHWSNEPFLGSDDTLAENSTHRLGATWLHLSLSSTSSSLQLSPWVKGENASQQGKRGRTKVLRHLCRAARHLLLSMKHMGGGGTKVALKWQSPDWSHQSLLES